MPKAYDPEDPATVEARSNRRDDSGADAAAPAVPRPSRRRTYQVAAAVGVAAVLGTSVAVVAHLGHEPSGAGPAALDGLVVTPSTAASPGAPAAAGAPAPAASAPAAPPASSTGPAPAGVPVTPSTAAPVDPATPPAPARTLRPLPPAPAVTGNAAVTITSTGSIKDERRTLRVVSALTDLSGQRELAWAADAGRPVGSARCTQNFRFSPDSPVGVRSTMLLCWRTSANKSVYAVAVELDHRPSEQATVAAIGRVWSKLG